MTSGLSGKRDILLESDYPRLISRALCLQVMPPAPSKSKSTSHMLPGIIINKEQSIYIDLEIIAILDRYGNPLAKIWLRDTRPGVHVQDAEPRDLSIKNQECFERGGRHDMTGL